MVDTHAHIYLEEFEEQMDQLFERASGIGVEAILMPAIDRDTHDRLLNLNKKYPAMCLPMMGVHPCSIKDNYQEELDIAEDLLRKHEFIAVGETGLDFYWDKTY